MNKMKKSKIKKLGLQFFRKIIREKNLSWKWIREESKTFNQHKAKFDKQNDKEKTYFKTGEDCNEFGVANCSSAQNTYVPVYLMLPLDFINNDGNLNNQGELDDWFGKIKNEAGADGVMADVWWGIVESNEKNYNWAGYDQLVSLLQKHDLKLQCVMSFHQCGTNTGDKCYIPLPQFVLDVGNSNPDIYYTDKNGHRDQEYLSLGVDTETVFNGRSAVDMYNDFMSAFASHFADHLGNTIVEVQVGLGPAGEMRYPSYQLQDNLWKFPGVGGFQCFDKYMKASLQKSANNAGHSEYNKIPSVEYNSYPYQTSFFTEGTSDNYRSQYGAWFLSWYSQQLISHGDRVLAKANAIFSGKVQIAAKISGIHWWYKTSNHAAECTTGYFNTDENDGYRAPAQLLKKYDVLFDFTCLEMSDSSQPSWADCGPQELVQQTLSDAKAQGIKYGGENALNVYDTGSFGRIENVARQGINSFTYLRLTSDLINNGGNWNNFKGFVWNMHNL
ncbi:hypothetical protein M0813_11705 [Anaeramoeba flamelloides]|uniref:Beta-amylase n=1 Tax=Anaeramoeba flamelloides TaxID=1746091 RepID=A0ABQ8ZE88_9EUKA|nr:hypothetical protein M0813_11705 [Anaeramoeba flamelloides]